MPGFGTCWRGIDKKGQTGGVTEGHEDVLFAQAQPTG